MTSTGGDKAEVTFYRESFDDDGVIGLPPGDVTTYRCFTEAGLADHDRQVVVKALRDAADEWTNHVYPTDVFRPLDDEKNQRINEALFAARITRDAVSADVMRHAARLLEVRADRIERGGAS